MDPYSYVENGTLKGIIPDYFAHLMQMAGLPYTTVIANNRDEYTAWQEAGGPDVILDCRYGSSPSAEGDFGIVTEPYMQLTTSRITRKGFSGTIGSIATADSKERSYAGEDIASDVEYRIASSPEEAMQLVSDGKADACYVYTYRAEKFINKTAETNLQLSVLKEPAYNEYICISSDSDHELAGILNKCIKADSSGALDEYVRKYTTVTIENVTLNQYLKLHPQLVIIAAFLLIAVFALVAASIVKTRTAKMKGEQIERNLERLNQVKGLASQFAVLYFVNLDTLETENNYLEETPDGAKEIDKASENFFEAFKNSMVVYAHPDYRDELLKFADPEYVRELLKNKRRVEYNFPCMNASGEYAWTDMVLMKFSENESDEPVNIAVGYMDTDTETRERLEAYRRNERDLEAIRGLANEYDTLQFVNLEDDTYYPYYMTNDSPEAAKEQADGEQKFTSFFRESMDLFCHPDFMQEMVRYADPDYLREILKKENKHTHRFLCNSDNGYQWCEFALIRLDEEEMPKRMAVGYTNIDAAVKEEQEQQRVLTDALSKAEAASKAKSEFLFNMSHDIRTPMNAITGFTDQAIRHKDDPEMLDAALAKVKESSAYLLGIINDILDMAKIESGKLELNEELHIAEEGKNTLLEVFGAEAAKKGIRFHTAYNVQDKCLWIDENRTNQIVANLLSNAIKYTEKGGDIWYSVKQIPSEKNGYGRFAVSVKDTGCGMSKEFLAKVFDAFERDASAKENGVQGTGLGMAIVKKLTEAMGGTIEIESEPGKGTNVSFVTEHRIATQEEIAAYRAREGKIAETIRSDFRGKKILLVEDNELNREIATDILDEEGLVVEEAEDGAKAVDILKEKGPDYYDFVLMDIQMPNMNGYEATRTIRSMYPGAKLPIIALSANAFAEDKVASIEAGMDDHVAKPINIRELFTALARFL